MTDQELRLRRGLPRRPGGEPWPADALIACSAMPASAISPAVVPPAAASEPVPAVNIDTTGAPDRTQTAQNLRRGLPRVPGGEAWPPAAIAATAAVPDELTAVTTSVAVAATTATEAPVPATGAAQFENGPALRRGLPRFTGGEPWPPAGFAVNAFAPTPAAPSLESTTPVVEEPASYSAPASAPVASAQPVITAVAESGRVSPAPAAAAAPTPKRERASRFSRPQLAVISVIAVALIGLIILAARWLVATESLQAFLETYPGEYPLPETAPVGIPAWLGWQHFFSAFLMVLIIRSGLQVRREKRPEAFWTPRWNSKRKISLTLWFHQSLDIFWVANGALYIALLFITGQWMKIVPTSWTVFPNALSAGLQYISMDWPTENGWVNYNGLQQLAYFTTVFVAAPLAIASGVRMSGIWPARSTTLSRLYPIELARKIHFPVMLYFVGFIIIHVALVLATGALRNLNHMFATQDDNSSWAGLILFLISVVIIVAAVFLARPLFLTPVANLFGRVSRR